MRSLRVAETIMLGYTIERVESYDAMDLLEQTRYEALSSNGAVIGSADTLRGAQNLVLTHELEIATHRRAA